MPKEEGISRIKAILDSPDKPKDSMMAGQISSSRTT
jgi:hypothetical protein